MMKLRQESGGLLSICAAIIHLTGVEHALELETVTLH